MSYWRTDRFLPGFIFLPLLLLLALASCEEERMPAAFFPVDSLITAQAGHLASMKAGLQKEALLSGTADTVRYVPGDTATWLTELDIFRELETINKPVNRGGYLVSDGLLDPGSNLTVKAFKSLRKLPVVSLKVYYQGSISRLRKLEALYDESNPLYHSSRSLLMHFQQIDDRTVLTSYEVRGGQKMVLGDTVAFFISGKILVD